MDGGILTNPDGNQITLKSACALAKHGIAVHWLHPRAKRPRLEEWSTAPLNTPAMLRESYVDGYNVGIRLGEYSKIGEYFLHVIDLDIRTAVKAEEALSHLQRMLPGFEQLPYVISGSGGDSRHFYFVTDCSFRSRKLAHSIDKFADAEGKQHWHWEIELFGTGKQVACPPSIHPSGNPYKWGREINFDLIEMDLGGPFVPADTVQGWGVTTGELGAGEQDDFLDEVHRRPRNLSDEQVKSVLARLSLDEWCEDRNGWLNVGMALHHQYEGSDKGFEIWTIFSKKSNKYQSKTQRTVWESFGKRSGNSLTMATLIKAAGGLEPDDTQTEEIDGFPLTEDGVGLAFAEKFNGKLKFCHSTDRWYVWSHTHWRREETRLAFEWARVTCREHAEKAPNKSAAAKAASKASFAAAVERYARSDRAFAVTADVWDRDPWLLGTPGGTVDLRTGRLRPADPDDMITRLTAVAPVPIETFDPERDCPLWMAFRRQALNDDAEAIRFLQQWFGYSLTAVTHEQALVFVYGPGGSGKGTAINTFADVMGDYAINVAPETLTASKFDRHTTELARLKGARMARSTETEEGRPWAESRIKTLTGGDKITARFMRQDDFEFVPEFKLSVIGNHAPRIVNCDEAMRRRINVLPFFCIPAKKDTTLREKLRPEWSGILTSAIVGCLDWQANGLVRPAIVRQETDAYFASQDTFALWVEEECETSKSYADSSERLWDSWSRFASSSGEDPGNRKKSFPERLKAKGFEPIRDTAGIRGRGFKGLRVIERSALDDGSDDDVDLIG